MSKYGNFEKWNVLQSTRCMSKYDHFCELICVSEKTAHEAQFWPARVILCLLCTRAWKYIFLSNNVYSIVFRNLCLLSQWNLGITSQGHWKNATSIMDLRIKTTEAPFRSMSNCRWDTNLVSKFRNFLNDLRPTLNMKLSKVPCTHWNRGWRWRVVQISLYVAYFER